MKKPLYLFLALLLPCLIFVFLKYGGKNKFDIPIYFEQGVDSLEAPCVLPNSKPYRLSDSTWKRQGIIRKEANVVVFPEEDIDVEAIEGSINEELGGHSITFLNGITLGYDSATRQHWSTCVFLLQKPHQSVLVDGQGRIRGYYDLRLRDEMDRLRVELKIILEQY